jgi:hypothetical protein
MRAVPETHRFRKTTRWVSLPLNPRYELQLLRRVNPAKQSGLVHIIVSMNTRAK